MDVSTMFILPENSLIRCEKQSGQHFSADFTLPDGGKQKNPLHERYSQGLDSFMFEKVILKILGKARR